VQHVGDRPDDGGGGYRQGIPPCDCQTYLLDLLLHAHDLLLEPLDLLRELVDVFVVPVVFVLGVDECHHQLVEVLDARRLLDLRERLAIRHRLCHHHTTHTRHASPCMPRQ
jgi:hypothetical protein